RAQGREHRLSVARHATVGAALRKAGLAIRDGRLLAAVDHRVIDPHLHRGRFLVGGRPASPARVLMPHDRITLVDGQDALEATRQQVVAVPPPALPTVMYHVQQAGSPGRTREVVGVRSHEVVSREVLVKPVPPHQVRGKVVALTFDDGPSPTWTPAILAILAAKHVPATFCEIGTEVNAHRDLSRAVASAGHQLCNHTLSHDEHLDREDRAAIRAQINGGRMAFAAGGLPAPRYYRPPGGAMSAAVAATARSYQEQVVYWKVDTEDWKHGATPESIMAKVQAQVDNGAIILMHDGGGDRSATVAALGPVIDQLRVAGYTFVFPIMAATAH
ncbi:MAG TPA: polysaccharide deacetylase family protein, partial [Acidimicrobiales bacterium]